MLIYWVIFGLLSLLSVCGLFKTSKRFQIGTYILIFLLLVFFCGLRGENVGFDYGNYKQMYLDLQYLRRSLVEPVFYLLIRIFYPIQNFSIFLLIVAFISIVVKFEFNWIYSPYPFVGILIFYVTLFVINEMGQIRYGLAVSVSLIYFGSLVKRKRYNWVWILLANLIHYSTLLLWPTLLIFKKKLSSKTLIILLLIASLFYIVNINTILLMIADYLPIDHVRAKVLTLALDKDGYGKALGINLSLFLRISILLGLFYLLKMKYDRTWNIFFNLYLYGLLIYMIFNSNAEFAIRGSGFFKALEIVILPMFIYRCRGYGEKVLALSVIILYCGFSLWKIICDPLVCEPYIPYSNYYFSLILV